MEERLEPGNRTEIGVRGLKFGQGYRKFKETQISEKGIQSPGWGRRRRQKLRGQDAVPGSRLWR